MRYVIRLRRDATLRFRRVSARCRNVPFTVPPEACSATSTEFPRVAALHIMLIDWGDAESPANSCPANRIPRANWGCDKMFVQTPDTARWVTLCLRCH